MKLHKEKIVTLRKIGATRLTTLCGRMNKNFPDGMNIADTDEKVTCKFCRSLMVAA